MALSPEELQRLIAQQGSTPPATTTPQSTAPATTQTGGVTPGQLYTSPNQPTTSSTGVLPPVTQPTTTSTGVQPPVPQPTTTSTGVQPPVTQPTTSSTGVQSIVQPTTSSTGITLYETPGITPTVPTLTPGAPPTQAPGVPAGAPPIQAPGVPPAPPPAPPAAPLPEPTFGRTTQLSGTALPVTRTVPPPRTFPTAATFEEVLAQLRQERADWDEATDKDDAKARAEWLTVTEGTIANLRTPDEQAVAMGDALLDATEEDLRQIMGRLSWVRETHMGTVLKVDRATKTCRVRIGTDALNPSAVPWERKISYGLIPPTVGKTYPVHFPVVVPRRPATLTAGPQTDPEHLPWLKVPGGKTDWLYYERWTDAFAAGDLWRIPWPLEDDDTPASGEFVQNLRAVPGWTGFPGLGYSRGLVGYNVGARALVAFNVEGFPSTDRKLLILEDWGFGTGTVRTVPVGDVFSPINDPNTPDVAHLPLMGISATTEAVPSGIEFPPTTIKTVSFTIQGSLDGGVTWIPSTVYPAEDGAVIAPDTGLPFLPFSFGQLSSIEFARSSIALAKAPGCVTLADLGPLPAGTLVRPYIILRCVGDPTTYIPHRAVAYSIGVYLPETAETIEVSVGTLPHAQLAANAGLMMPINAHIRQTEEGQWVCYLALTTANVVNQLPFFNDSASYALYRGLGPLDNLTWTALGPSFFDNGNDGPHLKATEYGQWFDPVTPLYPLATSEDGTAIITWTAGYDYDLFPSHKLIYSLDYGDTWTLLPPAWQPTLANDTVFGRPTYIVPIPSDDPRAVPVGG